MSLTECSYSAAGSSVCSNQQSSNAEDRLLAGAFSTPVLAGLSCTMDVSKLLVALTAPLLNSPVPTHASRTEVEAGYESSTRENTNGIFKDGHSREVHKTNGGIRDTEGRREHQEKQQQVAATLPPCRPVSYAVEQEAAAVVADDNREALLISRKQEIAEDYTAVCRDAAPSRRKTGSGADRQPAANGFNLQNGLTCEQHVDDAANIIGAVTQPTIAQHSSKRLEQEEAVKVSSTALRPTEPGTETHGSHGSKTEPEIHDDGDLGNTSNDVAPHALPSSAPPLSATPAVGEGEAANENPGTLGMQKTETLRESGLPCGDAHTPQVQNSVYRQDVRAQSVEPEQQILSPRVSAASRTVEQPPHVQQQHQRERPGEAQPLVTQEGAEEAEEMLIQSGRHHETQHEQQETRRQSGNVTKGGGPGNQQQTAARGDAQQRGGLGDALGGAVGRTEQSDGAGKQETECALPSTMHQERQLLRETLELLKKTGYPSEDSTGSLSTWTALGDAADDDGGEKYQNGSKMPQELQQYGALKELKRQLLQQFSSKKDLEGYMNDGFKRCMTAVLAAALEEKEANPEEEACTTSRPVSPSSHGTRSECFTRTSSARSASSESQSPLTVQKEEAPEGARRDSTTAARSRSTSRGPHSNKEYSDPQPRNEHSTAHDAASVSSASGTGTSYPISSATGKGNAVGPNASASDSSVDGRRRRSILSTSNVSESSAGQSGSAPCSISAASSTSTSAEGSVCDSNTPDDSRCASNQDVVSGSNEVSDEPCTTSVSWGFTSSSGAEESGTQPGSGTPSTSTSISCPEGSLSHETGSGSSSGATLTPAAVGEAVLKDCLHSVIDLEQHAARVLMLSPTEGGAAKQNVLPSLLLQKTAAGGGGQLSDCGLWGAKMEKEEIVRMGGTSEEAAFSAASSLGFYPSALGDAATAGFRKDTAGPLLLPSLPDANIQRITPDTQTYTLLQQQLAGNPLFAGVGGVVGTEAVTLGDGMAPGARGTETAAGMLEQSLSQMWLLQQRGNSLAPLPTAAQCPFEMPTALPTSLPWMQPVTACNIGPAASIARPPTPSAVAAAALLPRSFRSRSDYLSLCNLQGCSTTQENERKPRTLEELRQLPPEEHISLQEMHLLAEQLVRDFMRLDRSSVNLTASSELANRGDHREWAVGSAKSEKNAVTGVLAAMTTQRTELLVLHYRRDNLSFSVTPASAFTPYPPSVFESGKMQARHKNAGAVRASARDHKDMEEMEEEKNETLLGGRFFTSSSFGLSSSCSPYSLDKSGVKGRPASQRQSKTNAAEETRPHVTTADDADDFVSPQATTHFFRARCQQAGTEVGISDSTIGAVDRAFAEATASFLRETQRQNVHLSFCTEMTKQIVSREEERAQQQNSRSGKTTGEELRINGPDGVIGSPLTRGVGIITRGHQRLIASDKDSADWYPARMK